MTSASGATSRTAEGRCIDRDDARRERRYTERPHPRTGDRPRMDGIRCRRQVVWALRNRADLAIDLPAANARRPSTGDFAAISGLRVFATSFAWGREIARDAEPGFDRRDLCRRDCRVTLPLGASGISRPVPA